jgi:hypothetical protein
MMPPKKQTPRRTRNNDDTPETPIRPTVTRSNIDENVASIEIPNDNQDEGSDMEKQDISLSDSPKKKKQKKQEFPAEEVLQERNRVLERNRQMNKFIEVTARGEGF